MATRRSAPRSPTRTWIARRARAASRTVRVPATTPLSSWTSPCRCAQRGHRARTWVARRVGAMPLDVRPIDRETHLAFVTERSASFLQCPSWAGVKAEWGHLSLGWFDGPKLVGSGLALLRRTPGLQRYLAYLPEGPVLDWQAYDPKDVLSPLKCTL